MFQILERDSSDRIMQFRMRRPDNWHGHLRRGARMRAVVMYSAYYYARMTIMPNTGPIWTPVEALVYRQEIVDALIRQGFSKERAERFARMTVYLHQGTTEEDIRLAKEYEMDFKFYPKNDKLGTTGSQAGVPTLFHVERAIASMEQYGVRLLVHGESATHPDVLDLERRFVEEQMAPLADKYPNLHIVGEHLSTMEFVQFVQDASSNMTATVTPQHLWYSVNSLFENGLRPHRYCLPLYKHREDLEAIIRAVTSGNKKFCAGDDTAPHPKEGPTGQAKLTDCGCAGAFVAPVSLPMYITAFEKAGALDQRFEDFMSVNGAVIRNLPLNEDTITLERRPWVVANEYDFGNNDVVVPLCAGETMEWRVVSH